MPTTICKRLILTVGVLALPFSTQLSYAQSCTPGLGNTSNLLFGVWSHAAPSVDYTSFIPTGATTPVNFTSPGAVLASSANHAWVLDSGRVLSLTYTGTGAPLTGSAVAGPGTSIASIAWDGTFLGG